MNFKKFFDLNNSKPQHRTNKRIVDMNADRKHQNIVAKSQSCFQYKNPLVDDADLNGKKFITNTEAQKLANQYGLNIDKENKTKHFKKQLKDSGKFLIYIPNKGYYIKNK
jgi:hypothetical protein